MAMRSICPGVVLEDPKEDYKNGYRAEQFRVGKQAIYMAAFPGTKYLPFSAIRQAWTQDSSITVTGTCGKSLPVVVLRVRYEGNFYQSFQFEKQSTADRVLESIAAGNPDAVIGPEPVGEARRAMLRQQAAQ